MENKHQSYDLAQMQSLPLSAKIIMTEQRIKQWYDAFDGEVYVSVSGGKDSQVLAHIVKNLYPDVPCVFVNTGLEYDSVRLKGNELADEILRPEMSFVEVITKYGYPVISKEISLFVHQMQMPQTERNAKTRNLRLNGIRSDGVKVQTGKIPDKWKFLIDAPFRISNYCCDVMKKKPAHKYDETTDRKPFIGTMADESRQRKKQWMQNGCNAFNKKNPTSQPLSFWTEQDILHYIKINDLKIAEVYGDVVYKDEDGMVYDNDLFSAYMPLATTGAKRTGCVFCMFGITQDPERFLRLKEEEPNKYDYVMRGGKFDEQGMWIPHNGLGYKFVIDWINEHGGFDIKY